MYYIILFIYEIKNKAQATRYTYSLFIFTQSLLEQIAEKL